MSVLKILTANILGLVLSIAALADGTVSEDIRIESKALGYALQYRVYIPDLKYARADMPTLYVTDGFGYIEYGKLPQLLDHEIEAGTIEPVVVIFVDARSPDNLSINRRNQQFFCNESYAKFYVDELIPTIAQNYTVSKARQDRVILGLSFGGMNSACFGFMIPQTFGGIAMQSPANSQSLSKLSGIYDASEKIPIKLFLSFGTIQDNILAGRRFKAVLQEKGYTMTYKEVRQNHSWKNWGPLLDDVLATFFLKNTP
jgi:enterochelin esterase-like enzyme